ncbi:MAG TPA: tetratricopeptide repeat protein [Planctomycetaceae bacterium]|nr:tetratricopeptide repeat protein [Planctomycetaceae bacterium]
MAQATCGRARSLGRATGHVPFGDRLSMVTNPWRVADSVVGTPGPCVISSGRIWSQASSLCVSSGGLLTGSWSSDLLPWEKQPLLRPRPGGAAAWRPANGPRHTPIVARAGLLVTGSAGAGKPQRSRGGGRTGRARRRGRPPLGPLVSSRLLRTGAVAPAPQAARIEECVGSARVGCTFLSDEGAGRSSGAAGRPANTWSRVGPKGRGRAFRSPGGGAGSLPGRPGGVLRLVLRSTAAGFAVDGAKISCLERSLTMAEASAWIVETTTHGFQQDVIDRSQEVPVVVDFWAAWCQPCRMLGPLLEKLAVEFDGRFVLVKVDADRNPEIAAAFQVQSIPAVFAVREGQVVDYFVGTMSESELRRWLEGVVPDQAGQRLAEARNLERTNPAAAEAKYRQVLEADPNKTEARIGLARAVAAQERLDEASRLLDELAEEDLLDAEGEQLRAELAVRAQGGKPGQVEEARRAAAAAPDDLGLQLNLARALAADKHYTEAMDICLDLVQKDRQGAGEEARALMVQIFQLLGATNPLVDEYRRKLTILLY